MTPKEIRKVEKYFSKYRKGQYHSPFYHGNEFGIYYFHKKEDLFHIIIFEDGEVYQLNSDHEIQGIELKNLTDLRIRFKSFTGEKLNQI